MGTSCLSLSLSSRHSLAQREKERERARASVGVNDHRMTLIHDPQFLSHCRTLASTNQFPMTAGVCEFATMAHKQRHLFNETAPKDLTKKNNVCSSLGRECVWNVRVVADVCTLASHSLTNFFPLLSWASLMSVLAKAQAQTLARAGCMLDAQALVREGARDLWCLQ